jgi:hypothetical protein
MHLRAQFARLGVEVLFHPRAGLCTMRAAGQAMPWARRSLIECCAAAGLPDRRWHTGLGDARGAADVLCHLLQHAPHLVEPDDDHRAATVRPGAPKSAKLPAICETFLRCWAELPHVPETAGLVLPQENAKLAGRRVCRGSGSVRRDSGGPESAGRRAAGPVRAGGDEDPDGRGGRVAGGSAVSLAAADRNPGPGRIARGEGEFETPGGYSRRRRMRRSGRRATPLIGPLS